MLFDEILGQEHLKQMIQSSIEKNGFPQSNIIVDKDQYGGLHFALAISEQLLKAGMIRFREHFRIFAKSKLFRRKHIFRENTVLVECQTFLVQNALLRLGVQSQKLPIFCTF